MARIAHLAVKVTDIDAPSAFLESVFGFRHTGTVVHPATSFNATGKGGGHTSRHLSDGIMDLTLVHYDDDATAEPGSSAGTGPSLHHFGIEADDPQSFAEAIASNGGQVLSAPGMPTVKFREPGGIMSEVVPTGWFSEESIVANAKRRRRNEHARPEECRGAHAGRRGYASEDQPRLTHIAIKVGEVDKTCAFFERVFGFEVIAEYWERDHLAKHLTDGTIDLAIVRFDRDTDAARAAGMGRCIHHFGIDVPEREMAQYRDKLQQAGCAFVSDPGAVTVKFRLPGGGALSEIAPFGWHLRAGTPS
ncbi:MAG: VOC family protein [Betaproteobacteria bacterium]|nr:VOC family protein [Betaproteobacteria bacterium]